MVLIKKYLFVILLLSVFSLEAQITRQPKDTAACESGRLFFKVNHAYKGSVNFAWQIKSTSGVWRNLNNSAVFANTSTDSLVINMRDSLDGRLFRCVLDSAGRFLARTDSALLTLRAATRITSQPSGNALCPGSSHTFSVGAVGNGTLTYLWFKDNSQVPGQNAKDYSLTNIVSGNAGTYRCTVTGRCGAVNSNNAVLVVQPSTQITTQPQSLTRCEGDSAVFSVAATGLSLTYQWRKNTNNIAGRTASSLTLSNIGTGDAADYTVVVTGTCGVLTSSAATLTVNTKPSVTRQPRDTSICPSLPVAFSVSATGTGLTYQWQVNTGSGWSNITAAGTSPGYSGLNASTLVLSSPQVVHDQYQYRCIISGTCAPSVTSAAGRLTLFRQPSISTQPVNNRLCERGSGTFSLTASGTGLRYQWQRDSMGFWRDIRTAGSPTVFSNWTSAVLGISNVQQANAGNQFRCVVSGTCSPAVTSNAVRLSIDTLPTVIGNPVNRQVCEGNSTNFGITARGTGLTYRWQVFNGSAWSDITQQGSNPQYQDWNTRVLTISGVVSWNTGYRYRCIIQGVCNPGDTSSEATLSVSTRIAVIAQPANDSRCAGSDARFTVLATGTGLQYNWQRFRAGSWQTVNPLIDGQNFSGAGTATLNIWNVDVSLHNASFRCRIFNAVCPDVTSTSALLQVNANPVVALQADTGICRGDSLRLRSVLSSGTGGYRVEWVPSIGMDNPYALDATFKPNSNSQYILSVRDSLNCAGNDTIKVAVYDLPNGTADALKEICEGETAQMNAAGGFGYSWQPTAGLNNPNIPAPLASPAITTEYTVTIRSREGCAVQRHTEVRVHKLPQLVVSQDTSVCRGADLTLSASGADAYKWEPANWVSYTNVSNPRVNTSSTRTYAVEGKSLFGCVSRAQVRVNVLQVPSIEITPDTHVCAGKGIRLFAAGGNQFAWTPIVGLSNPNVANPLATPTFTTRYKVRVTNAFGCSRDSSVLVNVKTNPVPQIEGIDQLCKGDSGVLRFAIGQGINTQQWSPAGFLNAPVLGTARIYPTATTTFRLQVKDNWGCAGNDSFVVRVVERPVPKILGSSLVCKNATMLNYSAGSSDNLVKWSIRNGSFSQSPWGNQVLVNWFSGNNGALYVEESLKDAPYCSAKDSLPVSFRNASAPPAPAILAEGGNLRNGILVSPQLKAKYVQWGYEDKHTRIEKATCRNIIWCNFGFVDTLYRFYWVKAGDDSICTTKAYLYSPKITHTEPSGSMASSLRVYPNPVQDVSKLSIEAGEPMLGLDIYTASGRLVYADHQAAGNFNYRLKTGLRLEAGLYLFVVRTASGTQLEKVLVDAPGQ
ncbi:MAG: T9SS type A sorting domain-containing protein [Bacteroidota bacterium]